MRSGFKTSAGDRFATGSASGELIYAYATPARPASAYGSDSSSTFDPSAPTTGFDQMKLLTLLARRGLTQSAGTAPRTGGRPTLSLDRLRLLPSCVRRLSLVGDVPEGLLPVGASTSDASGPGAVRRSSTSASPPAARRFSLLPSLSHTDVSVATSSRPQPAAQCEERSACCLAKRRSGNDLLPWPDHLVPLTIELVGLDVQGSMASRESGRGA